MDVGVVTLRGKDGLAVLRTVLHDLTTLLIDDGLVRCPLNSKLLELLVVFGLLRMIAADGARASGDPGALE